MDDEDQTRGKATMSDRRVASGFQFLSVKKDEGREAGVYAGRGQTVMNDVGDQGLMGRDSSVR